MEWPKSPGCIRKVIQRQNLCQICQFICCGKPLQKREQSNEAQKLRHSQKKLPKFKPSIKIGKKHYLTGMVFGATKKISNKQQIYG